MSLFLPSGMHQLRELIGSAVVITGTARSGKTLVGNLLGSCQHVEHIDEPWLLMVLPVLAGERIVPEALAVQMFQTCLVELWYERVLMRNVSLRPEDRSSIWRQKSPQEIFSRLIGLSSREDARRYVHDAGSTLVLTLTDTVPYCDFFRRALPGCSVIHVVREGLDVALEVAEKHWFADEELMRPVHSAPYRMYLRPRDRATCYLPYWVERGQEERFLASSEFTRGLWYWRRLMEAACARRTSGEQVGEIRTVRLRDVLDQPGETIGELVQSLGLAQTELTKNQMASIGRQEERGNPGEIFGNGEREELIAVRGLYQELGLPAERLEKLLLSGVS